MSNYFRLLKLDLTNSLITRSKSKKDIIIVMVAIFSIAASIYYLSTKLFAAAKSLEILILLMAILAITLVTISTCAIGASKYLFNFKDYDFLMSLPISKSTIIISRITTIYFNTFLTIIILFVPTLIVFLNTVSVSSSFLITLLIVMMSLPIVPIVIGSIVSIIISYISSFLKSNKFINLVFNLGFLVVFYYFYFKFSDSTVDFSKITGVFEGLIQSINSKYPLAKYYTDALLNNNYLSLLKYLVISIFILVIFVFLLEKIYLKLNTFLKIERTKRRFKYRKTKASQFKALCLKEWKKIYSNPTYFLNALLGSILIIGGTTYLFFNSNSQFVKEIINQVDAATTTSMLILLLSVLLASSCTTHSSISLEGRSIYMIKTFPMTIKTYLNSKIFVNLLINTIALIFGATVVTIVFKLKFNYALLVYLIPMLFSVFNIIFSLIINLKFPKFDFDNETKVIKQSMPAFISYMFAFFGPSLIITLMTSFLQDRFSVLIIFVILALVLGVVNLFLYKTLNVYGIKRFKEFE